MHPFHTFFFREVVEKPGFIMGQIPPFQKRVDMTIPRKTRGIWRGPLPAREAKVAWKVTLLHFAKGC